MARKGRKKFDVWKYENRRAGTKLDVVVYHVKSPDYRDEIKEEHFAVEIPEIGIVEADKDLGALKKRVYEALNVKLSVEWRRMLHLTVKGSYSVLRTWGERTDDSLDVDDDDSIPDDEKHADDDCGVNVEIRVKAYEITETPTGQKLMRAYNGRSIGDATEGHPETGLDGDDDNYRRYRTPTMRCLVPDTLENRQAINQLMRGFDRLVSKMHELFAPETAQETLAGVLGIKLLDGVTLTPPSAGEAQPRASKCHVCGLTTTAQDGVLLNHYPKATSMEDRGAACDGSGQPVQEDAAAT